jgi:ribosomal protein L37AE/L43A
MSASRWHDGQLLPGHLCPFCCGLGQFFTPRNERPSWWRCMACRGAGAGEAQPAQMRIGAAQGRFLKQYPLPQPHPERNA